MRKVYALLMAVVLMAATGTQCLAAEKNNVLDFAEETSESTSLEEVQPREVQVVFSRDVPFWPSYESSFHLNSKGNLKLVFASTAPCTISVYKGNSIIPMCVKDLEGNGSSKTYDIKNNCSAGDYSFILTTNDQNCFASMRFVVTQYT